MNKILILEDAKIGGQALQAAIEHGFTGNWFVCVKSVDEQQICGVRADGQHESVKLSDFALALVDGFLMLDGLMGWEVLPLLKDRMYTVSTSSIGAIGAKKEIDKSLMVEQLPDLLVEAGLLEIARHA